MRIVTFQGAKLIDSDVTFRLYIRLILMHNTLELIINIAFLLACPATWLIGKMLQTEREKKNG